MSPFRFSIGRSLLCSMMISAMAGTAAWASSSGYTHIAGPYPDDPLGVMIFRLDNGLEVYLSVNRDTPRFHAEIAVRTGSKFDPPETTGLAHYMEHLFFKGSERLGTLDFEKERPLLDRILDLYELHFEETDPAKRRALYDEITQASTDAAVYAAPNEFDRVYRAMGARDLNAHTWHEEVVYKVSLPANRLEQWAILESDRFSRPVFRLFQTELETVYEEMNRALDNKHRIIQSAVDARLYKRHPYGQQPTLGLVEHLKNPSIQRLLAFYDAWYVPNNMALFISGDIDIPHTIETIARHFNTWEPRELPQIPQWEDPPPLEREEVRVRYEAEPFVLLAFRTAPRNHSDIEALIVLDLILDNSTAGLINLNLNQRQRAREAGAFLLALNDYGAQYLYGVPKDGQSLEEVEQLLLEQLALLRAGAFDDRLLEAIINDYRKQEKINLETDSARVSRMRETWIGLEPWEEAYRIIERISKVTREDVMRVANQYFSGGYIAGFREDAPHEPPKVEKPPMPDIVLDASRQSRFAQELLAMPVTDIEPVFLAEGRDYRRIADDAGYTLYHVNNPMNDVFTLSLIIDCGIRQDNRMAVAARLMQRTGTRRLSPEELQMAWYLLGTEFSINVEENQTVITLKGLDERFDASVALLAETILEPSVEEEALDQLKRIILAQREDAKKNPQQISAALVEYLRYADNSQFLRMLPADAVLQLDAGTLQETIRALARYQQYILYTGTLPPENVLAAIRRISGGVSTLSPPPPYTSLQVRAPENTEIWLLNRDMAQSHIHIEFGDVPYDPALTPAIQLYNMYFAGGMAGIVFQELREARALAYLVGARYTVAERAGDQNVMTGIIQTQTDKTLEAVAAFVQLMDDMPLSPDRYAFARKSLINDYRSNRIGFRAIAQTALSWERRGITGDPRESWMSAIRLADSPELLESFYRRHIAARPKLISIVGAEARIDAQSLSNLGTIKRVAVSDIFVD